MEELSDDDNQTIETLSSKISVLEIGLDGMQNQMSTLMKFIMNEKPGVQHSNVVTPIKGPDKPPLPQGEGGLL